LPIIGTLSPNGREEAKIIDQLDKANQYNNARRPSRLTLSKWSKTYED